MQPQRPTPIVPRTMSLFYCILTPQQAQLQQQHQHQIQSTIMGQPSQAMTNVISGIPMQQAFGHQQIPMVQGMPSMATNIQPGTNIQPATHVQPTNNIQPATHMQAATTIQRATNIQQTTNMQQATNMQQTTNMQQATNIQPATNMQQATNIQPATNMKPANNIQPATNQPLQPNQARPVQPTPRKVITHLIDDLVIYESSGPFLTQPKLRRRKEERKGKRKPKAVTPPLSSEPEKVKEEKEKEKVKEEKEKEKVQEEKPCIEKPCKELTNGEKRSFIKTLKPEDLCDFLETTHKDISQQVLSRFRDNDMDGEALLHLIDDPKALDFLVKTMEIKAGPAYKSLAILKMYEIPQD